MPTEIRLKIWKEAAHLPRILEMGVPEDRGPSMCKMLPASHLMPAMLLVNHEAYEEGSKYYELRNFNIHFADTPAGFQSLLQQNNPVYYNPMADIIYFGETCPPWAIKEVSSTQRAAGYEIPKVAVLQKSNENFDYGYESDSWPEYAMEALRILHGFERSSKDTQSPPPTNYPGCPGLAEIFIVLNSSSLFTHRPHNHVQKQIGVDSCMKLRPVRTDQLLSYSKDSTLR